ncbi:MAG: leucyl-tRNA synthetase, leucyl-tRNA synthetase, partial [Candidatus Parcubacteria bacterium]
MKEYNHLRIEKKWQALWQKKGLYTIKDSEKGKKNEFVLVEFPYPSGNLHVGHWYAFAVPDMYARAQRMQGKNVLFPIGFDAFGLPAENAAIKRGINPRTWTYKNMAHMRKQIASMGTSFDWSREVVTCDPAYYKWTQWLFLQLYKKGLVYRKDTSANWCPSCKTVLANEQVTSGTCERCGHTVEQRLMPQWNIAITKYADRLVDDLNDLHWPEAIKDSQRNWIGRSEGAEIDFALDGVDSVTHIVLLHGKGGSPEKGMFPWLKKTLEQRGYAVTVPELPNSNEPNDVEQAEFVMKNCKFDKNTAILGHSFGGVVALRILERGVQVARVALAGTPYSGTFLDGKSRKTIKEACKHGFDFKKILSHAKTFFVLTDINDPIIPKEDGIALAQALNANHIKTDAMGAHFNGDKEYDCLMSIAPTIRVFTTRPETLYGATYIVLAPEHPWVTKALELGILKNKTEIEAYRVKTGQKTELERQENKEKSGVQIAGIHAINPATKERIPVFISDYVLAHYGTGAIMAVPGHDERDYAFAKKLGLPIKQVISRHVRQTSGADAVKDGLPFVERKAVMCIVKHWEKEEYLCQSWKDFPIRGFVSGGIEVGEDAITAGKREIGEESGYLNTSFIREVGTRATVEFYHNLKKENRRVEFTYLYFELKDDQQGAIAADELSKHEHVWKSAEEVLPFLTINEKEHLWRSFKSLENNIHTGPGYLIDSGEHTGLHSNNAKKVMTEMFGKPKKTYRLRDWVVSRQRYWGVPIPMVHCNDCGYNPVNEKSLPVELPRVTDYLPTGDGKSPLAKAKRWVKTTCPLCKKAATRETDTFDTFICSSWYYLRYTDAKNKKEFANKKKLESWLPVDMYSGGAEHTTMHVLYSRFWHKALYDLKLVKESEPYTKRMNRGLILGPDGQKMSKSKGNVIDPDDVVKRLGADTV